MGDDKAAPRRAGTVYGQRNEDRKSRPLGVPIVTSSVPQEFADPEQPGTGVTEGEALARVRANRETKDRLNRLENKSDQDRAAIADLRETVGRLEGRFDGVDTGLENVTKALDRLADEKTITFKASVEVDKAKQQASVQVDTAEKLDIIDARKARRTLIAKALGLLGAGGVLAELVHWIAGKL